jgi:hypothetical protein
MRDPRTDPRPGDVLRKGSTQRTVVAVFGNCVTCCVEGMGATRRGGYIAPWLSQFRRWAKDAEVLDTAESTPGPEAA